MAEKVLYKTDFKQLLFAGTKCYKLLDCWMKKFSLFRAVSVLLQVGRLDPELYWC